MMQAQFMVTNIEGGGMRLHWPESDTTIYLRKEDVDVILSSASLRQTHKQYPYPFNARVRFPATTKEDWEALRREDKL